MPDADRVTIPADIASARVLIVDDQQTNLTLLGRVLGSAGFTNILTTTDPTEVVELWASFNPDILLLDLSMPALDGFGVMAQLGPELQAQTGGYVPILVLTADMSKETKERALTVGAKDFLTKPFDHTEVLLRVKNLLETRLLQLELKGHNEALETKVRQRTAEIWAAANQLESSDNESRLAREDAVRRLSIMAEFRLDGADRHIERMSQYCALLTRLAGGDQERVELVRLASQMHDVGKIGLPESIVLKKSIFTSRERTLMQTHSEIGYGILSGSNSELLRVAASIAHTHHERWDGSGYPNGLEGEDIPIEGRIAAIGDVYDALTTPRTYRSALSFVDTFNLMREGRGTQFDAELLDLFLDSIDDVMKIQESTVDGNQQLSGMVR